MKDFPPKLTKFLSSLCPEDRAIQEERFQRFVSVALTHQFQSPRFWAMRMILGGENDRQITRRIEKKIRKTQKDTSSITGDHL